MNDPHVECLYYAIGTGSESISYGDPEPLSFSNSIGDFSLDEGKLTVELAEHFSDGIVTLTRLALGPLSRLTSSDAKYFL